MAVEWKERVKSIRLRPEKERNVDFLVFIASCIFISFHWIFWSAEHFHLIKEFQLFMRIDIAEMVNGFIETIDPAAQSEVGAWELGWRSRKVRNENPRYSYAHI